MRLLERKPSGQVVLHDFSSTATPAYAILSHTWGEDEVKFQEIADGKGRTKAGWVKIEFCANQARADGLQYFWIDTCCIDKTNSVELSEAINSMFLWYKNASRCYVYLSDVSVRAAEATKDDRNHCEQAFRASRWFTRGWTLQELIAPAIVQFYSREGESLGDKLSLGTVIEVITKIPENALRGDNISGFSISERMSWIQSRQTLKEEDQVYSLLGIFNVSMPIIYGEGRALAHRRLDKEIQKSYKGLDFARFAVKLNLSSMPVRTQFVAREKELEEIHKLLHGHKTRSMVVLHGLGGIGKTQLAVEYALLHLEKYSAIFWVNAADEDSLSLCFQGIAYQVLKDHPSTPELTSAGSDRDLLQTVRSVITWLELPENTQWLLVYDGLENSKIPNNQDESALFIHRFLPTSNHGSILATTRSVELGLGTSIHLSKLSSVQDGLDLLSRTSGRSCVERDDDAVILVQELDCFPLALSVAGAYIKGTATSHAQYLSLLRKSRSELQKTSLLSFSNHSTFATLQITCDEIQRQSPPAAKMLRLWAYFDRQDVWFKLLCHGKSVQNPWIYELIRDELDFEWAIGVLCKFGLVEPNSEQEQFGFDGYSMHSCVHSWATVVLNEQWDESLAELALTCVALNVPRLDVTEWWITQRRLLRHARRFEIFVRDGKMTTAHTRWALKRLANLYANQGKLVEAESMYVWALKGYEEALGTKHISTLDAIDELADLYRSQGKLVKAEEMYTRALNGKEETLGRKHISTLDTVNNLAVLYRSQGKLSQAEKMYIRALEGKEETIGRKNPSTLDVVNNLAILYSNQGKLAEAEKMFTRALNGKEETLGREHPSTLDVVNNLAILYADQGKLTEAESMYIRVLQGYRKALGTKHLSTLDATNNLGNLYSDQGKLLEAEEMYIRALEGKQETLGREHLSTLNVVNNLAILYSNQGKLAEAEQMYVRALQGKEKVLGPKHPATLVTLNNLANLYADQGKLDNAESMYIRVLQGYEDAVGRNHISTLQTVSNLASLYDDQGNLAKAEEMYVRARQGFEEEFGPRHRSTLDSFNNLGLFYADFGEMQKAVELLEHVMAIREKELAEDHPDRVASKRVLAIAYEANGRIQEAVELLEQVVVVNERVLAEDHPSRLASQYELAVAYNNNGQVKEAVQLLEHVVTVRKRVLAEDHPSRLVSEHALSRLYQEMSI